MAEFDDKFVIKGTPRLGYLGRKALEQAMAEHTKGLVAVSKARQSGRANIMTADGYFVAQFFEAAPVLAEANARRLAACWNALQGFTTAQIEAIVAEQERSITPEFVELHSRIPRT